MEVVSISYFGKQVVLIRENITNTVITSKPVGIFNHLNTYTVTDTLGFYFA